MIMTTDNINTFACFIYPDAEATDNPNGGIDWSKGYNGATFGSVAFFTANDVLTFEIPDSRKASVTGIDGVRKCSFCY